MAGKGNFDSYEHAIKQTWSALARDDYEIYRTKNAQDITNVCKEFSLRYQEEGCVYICGGDGSFSEAANALAHSNTALGFIPAGTANDFSRTLYSGFRANPDNLYQTVKKLITKSPNPQFSYLDLLSFTINSDSSKKHYSLNVLSFGADSKILKDCYEYMEANPESTGNKAYAYAVQKNIFAKKSYAARISIQTNDNTQTLDDAFTLAVFCNGAFYGNGFNPSPMANPQDGCFEFIGAKELSLYKFVPLISKYKKGLHLDSPSVYFYPMLSKAHIEIQGEKSAIANYDGTLFSFNSLDIELDANALRWAQLT